MKHHEKLNDALHIIIREAYQAVGHVTNNRSAVAMISQISGLRSSLRTTSARVRTHLGAELFSDFFDFTT